MNAPITYRGIPIVFQGPYCPSCGTEMKPCAAGGKLDCPLCRAQEEIQLLRAAAEGAIASLNSQRKYITDDIQAMGHSADAIAKLQTALQGAPHE